MARRNKAVPPIKLPLWQKDGDLWFAERSDLLEAIRASGNSDDVIRKRMGVGYSHLTEVLDGKRVNGWAVAHIEWGLTPNK